MLADFMYRFGVTLFLTLQLGNAVGKLCSTMNDYGDNEFFHTGSDLLFSVSEEIVHSPPPSLSCPPSTRACEPFSSFHHNVSFEFLSIVAIFFSNLHRIQLHSIRMGFLRSVGFITSTPCS